MKLQDWLVAHNACQDGAEWAKKNKITSASKAWKKLGRVDWMLWLVKERGVQLSESEFRHFAAAWDAASAAALVTASDAARDAARENQADLLRKYFTDPFRAEAKRKKGG